MKIEETPPMIPGPQFYTPADNKVRSDDEEKVLTLLPKDRQQARNLRQIADALDLGAEVVARALGKLIASGEAGIDRDTSPHTFWRIVLKPERHEAPTIRPMTNTLADAVAQHKATTIQLFDMLREAAGPQHTDGGNRWMSIARMDMQRAYMALERAILNPSGF